MYEVSITSYQEKEKEKTVRWQKFSFISFVWTQTHLQLLLLHELQLGAYITIDWGWWLKIKTKNMQKN